MLVRLSWLASRPSFQSIPKISQLSQWKNSRCASSASPFSSLTRSRHASRAHSNLPGWHHVSHSRGAKQKTTLNLEKISQGLIEGTSIPRDEEPEYPPLLQQVHNNMIKFSHCILLTRVGGFYEASDLCLDT